MTDPGEPTEPGDGAPADSHERGGSGAAEPLRGAPALPPARAALVERLAGYDRLLEVGVGRRPGVAAALAARGVDVTATDVHRRDVPEGVRFVRDDVVAAAERVRAGERPGDHYAVEAVYALNLPPELHRSARDVARAVDAEFLFTTLGGDQPAVPVRRETVGATTLFVATAAGQ